MSKTLTHNLQQYYTFQSKIYDTTRWSFLFGRKDIPKLIPYTKDQSFALAEIGCGTGYNLQRIQKEYPSANLIGMDLSADMLNIAKQKVNKNVQYYNEPYGRQCQVLQSGVDIIIFSYALTMINPGWDELIDKALDDLNPNGHIIVADFHQGIKPFAAHMSNHHVRMEGHILERLKLRFPDHTQRVGKAYLGIWEYFTFIGKKA